MVRKMSSRLERRQALRMMTQLIDRREQLVRDIAELSSNEHIPEREKRLEGNLAELRGLDHQSATSALMRPYSEADWIDKAAVFFTGNKRDVVLVIVTAALAALVTWLVLTGQIGDALSGIVGSVFGIAPAIAAEPGLLLTDESVLRQAVVMLAAACVGLITIFASIAAFLSKSASHRKEARDVLTTMVTFFLGILTGWTL